MRSHPLSPRKPLLGVSLVAALFAAAAPVSAGPSAPVATPTVQDGRAAKPDQVLARNRRTGNVSPMSGTVEENGLETVVVNVNGSSKNVDADLVVRVVFGDVPPSYRDGGMYLDRGDFENAAAKYQLAAGDASGRDVVRASARLRAAEALMRQGALDSAAFGQAASEAATFLADHPTNREVPAARFLQARATRLGGSAAEAAELYAGLFREAEGETPTPGYDWSTCLRSGMRAAHAYLAAGDSVKARETFSQLESTLQRVLGTLEEDAPALADLKTLQSQARLGEGWTMLASDNASQAMNFFRAQLANAGSDAPAALRFGARLGLAEALLSSDKVREAQIEFARVAALDHTDRDNVARALVGQARCALQTSDSGARANARAWLETVTSQYGDTPSVLSAQEMLASL